MMSITILGAAGIATSYPFSDHQKICDVGGGRGTLLSEVLLHHPSVRGVLVDAPGVLESAKTLLGTRGVADRVELVPGSFFESVPKGADAYLLKNVLHDWDDARARTILETIRRAMDTGKRLLVIEEVIEEGTEHHASMVDLHMMMVCSEGRERGRADFDRLFAETGFKSGRAFVTPTTMQVIEAVAA
jgi:hypothetical protein